MRTHLTRAAAGVLGALALLSPSAATPANAGGSGHDAVSVVDLTVNGLPGDQLGIGTPKPNSPGG